MAWVWEGGDVEDEGCWGFVAGGCLLSVSFWMEVVSKMRRAGTGLASVTVDWVRCE